MAARVAGNRRKRAPMKFAKKVVRQLPPDAVGVNAVQGRRGVVRVQRPPEDVAPAQVVEQLRPQFQEAIAAIPQGLHRFVFGQEQQQVEQAPAPARWPPAPRAVRAVHRFNDGINVWDDLA